MKLRPQRQQHGSAIAEAAVALGFLILVFIAIGQAGLAMHAAVTASNAAREAARAAVTLPPGDPYAAAARSAPGFSPNTSISRSGDAVTARVTIKTKLAFSAFGDWAPTFTATTTMRQER